MATATSPVGQTVHGADAATTHGASMAPDQVLEKVWLGPAPATNPEYAQTLHEAGITHVVNCTKDAPFLEGIQPSRQFGWQWTTPLTLISSHI